LSDSATAASDFQNPLGFQSSDKRDEELDIVGVTLMLELIICRPLINQFVHKRLASLPDHAFSCNLTTAVFLKR
jgi:hypothetical protein